MTIFKLYKS